MNGSEDNGFLIHDLWVRNFFLRYCAATPLEEHSCGMCVVFAERVGEIATSARFDSFYHALLISQRELSRQDERFALASTGSLASSGTLI